LHRRGAGGIRVALALTRRQDKFLQAIFKKVTSGPVPLAVVALGGYGRKELCFNSDIDIMFLTESEGQQEHGISIIQEYLYILMDAGLNIGHSVRSISECINIDEGDLESRMSLLEARFICGNNILFNKFIAAIREKTLNQNKKTFIRQISERTLLRHLKYGSTSK